MKMELKKGKQYILIFSSYQILTYQCTILEDGDDFVKFVDRKNTVYSFNKSRLISAQEV